MEKNPGNKNPVCTVLYSTVQYCTVLYSTVQDSTVAKLKKTRVSDDFWKSHSGTTFKNRRPYQSIRLEKSVSKMGLMHLICWTNDHFIKKTLKFSKRNTIFQDADFSEFSKISIFGLLTIVSYTVFCQDFHCGNEALFRRSKWRFMTKLHFFLKFQCFRFVEDEKTLKKHWKNLKKT